ncbi:MAG: PhnD/SsuA/transferrin family substrate-binding protein, partial [Kiritimatiellaeota bacterium]|nr:PhnD/SsuA/transferrin family substrate-binding protein [Kiritimatiellota bacterium]
KLVIGVSEPLCKKTACSCVGDNAKRAYDGLIAHVRSAAGIELEFQYFEEELLLQREIRAGRLDGMICKTWLGLTTARGAGREFTRLADITMPGKEPAELLGMFIVPKESPLKKLDDLRGKRVIFGMTNAYEKSYLANATFRAAGLPLPEPRQRVFSCQDAALALIEKRADAAVVSSYAINFGCICVVAKPEDFRVIAETKQRIPFVTFMVENKVAPAMRERLQKALLELKGDQTPKDLFSNGVIPPIPWEPEELKK